MEQRFRVVLAYLQQYTAGVLSEEKVSKVDKAVQTKVIEKMLKEKISRDLPEYRDKVFSVGGFVRDSILGKNPDDLDMVVDDPKNKMDGAEIFAKKLAQVLGTVEAHPLSEQYGIWNVVLMYPKNEIGERPPFEYDNTDVTGYILDIAPPRLEGPYVGRSSKEHILDMLKKQKDTKELRWVEPVNGPIEQTAEKLSKMKAARRPLYVQYTTRADDAKRRDLTINAIYKNVATEELEDHVGGLQDLKDKKLRPPEHPGGMQQTYVEDALRVLRLIRFKGKLQGFGIDPKTENVVKDFIKSPEGHTILNEDISKERISGELEKILKHPDGKVAVDGLETMKEYGFLKFISPSLEKMLDIYHDTVHHKGESVWQHTMEVLEQTPPTLKARLAALFHDVGKIETAEKGVDSQGRERVHFIDHDDVSAKMVPKILSELKFPQSIAKSVQNIVHSHMGFRDFHKQKNTTQLKNMRIFLEKMQNDLDDAMSLLKADAIKDPAELQKIEDLEVKLKKQREEDIAKGLLVDKGEGHKYIQPVSGDELMSEYGNLKGVAVGAALNQLRKMLLEGHFDNLDERQRAEKAKKLIKGMVTGKGQLEGIIKNYQEGIRSPKFFSVK